MSERERIANRLEEWGRVLTRANYSLTAQDRREMKRHIDVVVDFLRQEQEAFDKFFGLSASEDEG